MNDLISRQAAIDELNVSAELLGRVLDDADIVGAVRAKYEWGLELIELHISVMKELPSAQPEQSIPLSWIEEYIERLCNTRGIHSELRVNIINTMIDEWSEEQKGVKHGATD